MKLITLTLFLATQFFVEAQGFINLDFESARFTPHPNGGSFVYASNAIAGWTPYLGGIAKDYVAYNDASLGGALITIDDTNNFQGYTPVEGKYFSILFGASSAGHASASIGQTGQVPLSSQSILFWSFIFGSLNVSFNGNPLSFATTGFTSNNYTLYQADISPYAGQIGELLFSAPFNTAAIIDNIQFSITAVPEPGALALAIVGAALIARLRCQEK